MSSAHAHAHGEALARSNGDPTRTKTLRKRYAQKLRGEFADINTEIRDGVAERNVFRLGGEALAQRVPRFPSDSSDQKVQGFMEWMRRQQRRGVLETIDRDGNTYIRSAYSRGVQHADSALNSEGVTVPEADLEDIFNRGVHQDSLQLLYTQNYEALTGITDEVAKQVSRELTQGFAQGWGPDKIARNLTDRVDKIGKTRATVMARTEVINAHSTATLNRYEEMGADRVTIKAEWSTAGDSRVCPICASLEGEVRTVQEVREETFRYSAGENEPSSLSGEYRVQPPCHPQCRCTILPVIN